jgi:hypothetical protein
MALSEQEIIQEKNFNLYATLDQSLSCKPFSCNPYFKAGQRNFEDGKTVTVAGRLMLEIKEKLALLNCKIVRVTIVFESRCFMPR